MLVDDVHDDATLAHPEPWRHTDQPPGPGRKKIANSRGSEPRKDQEQGVHVLVFPNTQTAV